MLGKFNGRFLNVVILTSEVDTLSFHLVQEISRVTGRARRRRCKGAVSRAQASALLTTIVVLVGRRRALPCDDFHPGLPPLYAATRNAYTGVCHRSSAHRGQCQRHMEFRVLLSEKTCSSATRQSRC